MNPSPPNFLDLLNEVLDTETKERSQRSLEFRHNPSSASFKKASGEVVGACLRQLYYRHTGEPESDARDLTGRLQAGFGDAIHRWVLDKLAKSKRIRLTAESSGKSIIDPLTKEISFRLDGLVISNGELGGLEIKTVQSFGLQRMVKEGGPKESDILQVLSYFGTNEDLRWFSIVYLGRDTAYRAEYHILKTSSNGFEIRGTNCRDIGELKFSGIVERWKQLERAVSEKSIPARDYKVVFGKEGQIVDKRTKNGVDYKTDWRCSYCAYKTKCWSSEDAKEFTYKIPGA